MVTPEEIAGIEVFAMLSPDEQERLARAAADVTLVAGEYAATEGDERALFGVLEGRIEAVESREGGGRAVGERPPGGGVGGGAHVVGAPFPGRFRAAAGCAGR